MQLNRIGWVLVFVCLWQGPVNGLTCGEAILSTRMTLEQLARTTTPSPVTIDRARRLAQALATEISDALPEESEAKIAPIPDYVVTTLDDTSPTANRAKRTLLRELITFSTQETPAETTNVPALLETPEETLPVPAGPTDFFRSWGKAVAGFAMSAIGCHEHPQCSMHMPIDRASAIRDFLFNLSMQREKSEENAWKRRLALLGISVVTAPVALTALAATEGKRHFLETHVDLVAWSHQVSNLLENPDSDETAVLLLRQGTASVSIVIRHISENVLSLEEPPPTGRFGFRRIGTAIRSLAPAHQERHPVMLIFYQG